MIGDIAANVLHPMAWSRDLFCRMPRDVLCALMHLLSQHQGLQEKESMGDRFLKLINYIVELALEYGSSYCSLSFRLQASIAPDTSPQMNFCKCTCPENYQQKIYTALPSKISPVMPSSIASQSTPASAYTPSKVPMLARAKKG